MILKEQFDYLVANGIITITDPNSSNLYNFLAELSSEGDLIRKAEDLQDDLEIAKDKIEDLESALDEANEMIDDLEYKYNIQTDELENLREELERATAD